MSEHPTQRHAKLDSGALVVVALALTVAAAALGPRSPRYGRGGAGVRPPLPAPRALLCADGVAVPPHLDPRLFALRSEFGFSPPDEPLDFGAVEDSSEPRPWLMAKPAELAPDAPQVFDSIRGRRKRNPPAVADTRLRLEPRPGEVRVKLEDSLMSAGFALPSPPELLNSRTGVSVEVTAWVACSTVGMVLSVEIEKGSGDAVVDRAVELWMYQGRSGSGNPASGRVTIEAPASIWVTDGTRHES